MLTHTEDGLSWLDVGGPQLLAPVASLSAWRGGLGDVEAGDDYTRACQVKGYVGRVTVGGHDALVLGDEPFMTTILQHSGRTWLIRWSYAPEGAALLPVFRKLPAGLGSAIEETEFQVTEPQLALFAAAYPGMEAPERLEVSLSPGPYRVRTFDFAPQADMRFVVHALQPRLP